MKTITNINSMGKLDEHQKFLAMAFKENGDFWSAKSLIMEHLKQKCPEFFENPQTGASIEAFDYMVELLATLIDSDVYEMNSQVS